MEGVDMVGRRMGIAGVGVPNVIRAEGRGVHKKRGFDT